MKNVLFIAWYWPPSFLPGSQRVFQFARHLPDFGVQPRVLTGPDAEEVASIPLVRVGFFPNPAGWFGSKSGAPSGPPSAFARFKSKVLDLVWLNGFVPDARIGWRRPAVDAAKTFFEAEKPDLIFSSAPPYTTHLIARDLKQALQCPWVADFRDPWLESHVYNRSFRFNRIKKIHARMEREVLQSADVVTCATDAQKALLGSKVDPEKIVTITNGYDPAQWAGDVSLSHRDVFTVSHFGTVYEAGLSYTVFDVLRALLKERMDMAEKLRVRLIGSLPGTVRSRILECIPDKNLEISPPVPQEQILERLRERQLLLL
ncbi:MAG: glycosyltransferase, partial [Verrucomicrobiota bacterium]